MDLHRFWDGVITSSQNLTRLPNEATMLRTRLDFQRSQLTELPSIGFESWAKESFEIATKIVYRDGWPDRESEGWRYGLHDGRSVSGASCRIRC